MTKHNVGQWLLRGAVMMLGIAIMGTSIAGLFWANIGSDPTSVLVDGIHSKFGVTSGNASNIVNIGLLVLLLLVNPKKLGLATVACAFTLGTFIDLAQTLIFSHFTPQGWWIRLAVCLLSILLNGLALGLYLSANLGASAFDGLILTMHQRIGWSHKVAMYVFYAVVFVFGVAFGGVIGLGTVLSLSLCGIVFEFFLHFFATHLSPIWCEK